MAEQQMHGFRAKLDYWLKHNKSFYRFFNVTASAIMKLWGKFVPIEDDLVIFSGHSRKYNDSPKALYEYMISHPDIYGKYRCVWALEDPENTVIPGPAKKIKSDTIEYFRTTLKAKYWITCVNIERSLHYKKKGCRYINTWHGAPFKYGGNDAVGRRDYDFRSVDVFSYSSDFEKNIFLRAYRYREEICIPYGSPRNDELFNATKEEALQLKKKLNLPLDKKILIYAPTWRDSTDGGDTYAIKPPIELKKWEEALGNEYVLLMRTHQYTNKLLGVEFNDFCRDFCSYPNANDLLKVSDVMISDYSGIIADFSIFEKPILCFAYDYEQYKETRGLYLDYNVDMPSGILRTEDDVLAYLKNMNFEEECQKTKKMLKQKLETYGGHATETCLKKLFEK